MTMPTCARYCTIWNPKAAYPMPLHHSIAYCLQCINYLKPTPKPKEKPK